MTNTNRDFRLSPNAVHLCIDMQRLFGPSGIWRTPRMETVLPRIAAIASRFPERTIFTRFIPPHRPEDMPGTWRCYFEKWRHATREHIDPGLLELMPPFPDLAPPRSGDQQAGLFGLLRSSFAGRIDAKAQRYAYSQGAETGVRVLSTALGAIDHGYHVIIAEGAVCSSSDLGHDSLLALFAQRFSLQLEVAETQTIRAACAVV